MATNQGLRCHLVSLADVGHAFTQQPVGAEVIEGASADFTVAASGSTPLSYQWFKDGVALVGANGAADAGKTIAITVRVSNGAGQVTSQAASLVVQVADTGTVSGLINASEGGSLSTASGVTLEVPADALAGDATVTLRTQAPSEFTLPEGFTPVGEVITVGTGGASLNQPLYLSFPDPEEDLPPDTILVLAELTPLAGKVSKASASAAGARVKAAAISPNLFAVAGSALKGGNVSVDALKQGAYAIGSATAGAVGGVIGLSDPRRAQLPGTKDTACTGNDFVTKDNEPLSDESVLQSRHTACAIAPTVNTSVTDTDTAGFPRYGDMAVTWKWNVHGPSSVLGKNVRLSFDYDYLPRGTPGTAKAPVLKVLAKVSCSAINTNSFNPASVNCGGSADYTLNSGARDQGKDFKLTVDWADGNGMKIAEFRPAVRLYYTTDGTAPRADAAGNPEAGTSELDNSNMQLVMRCDKGQVWGSSQGCVFPKAAAVLDVSGTPQSAQHMREALAANPYLPGRYPGLKPGTKAVANEAVALAPGLQRLRVASLINVNRSKIQKVCAALPSPPPAGGSCPLVTDANVDTDAALEPCDCDEYPFASSRDGAAMPRSYGEASAKYIGSRDNRSAGAKLGAMLRRERIFDPYDHKRFQAKAPVFRLYDLAISVDGDGNVAFDVSKDVAGQARASDLTGSGYSYELDFDERYWIAF